MAGNVLALGEEADFEAENCLPPMNLIRSTKLYLTTEPPICCRCCYLQCFFFSNVFKSFKLLSVAFLEMSLGVI